MPLFLAGDCTIHELHQFVIRGAATNQVVQIVLPERKKASTDLAIGGGSDTAAVATEGLRDGGMTPISPIPSSNT
jgi:hypothetical protein